MHFPPTLRRSASALRAAHLLTWLVSLICASLPLPAIGQATPNSSEVIILGQPCQNPYVVAIPTADAAVLDRVQTYAPGAFFTDSRLGSYVQAGSFIHRSLADEFSLQLRHAGFRARTIYRPIACNRSMPRSRMR